MPHPWAMADANFPAFTGDESVREQIRQITDYMMMMSESLKYQLENLDGTNWNSTALRAFQSDAVKGVEALQSLMTQLQEKTKTLQEEADRMKQILRTDEDGNLTLGQEGKTLNLTGNVYINGKLME